LLRESSLDLAFEKGLDVDSIVERNQEKVRALGQNGFAELAKRWMS
jgi:hypothetical protein